MSQTLLKGHFMADELDELIADGTASESSPDTTDVANPTPQENKKGSPAAERIQNLVRERKERDDRIAELETQLSQSLKPDPAAEPENFVVDVVRKQFGSQLENLNSVADEVKLDRVLTKVPDAERYRDEIKEYGRTYNMPYDKAVTLVMAEHNKDVDTSSIDREAHASQLGGLPNPSARREDPRPQSKTTEQLESEIFGADESSLGNALREGIF